MTNTLGNIIGAARLCARGLLDLVLPEVCQGCGAADAQSQGLCGDCAGKMLQLVAQPYCARCGTTLAAGTVERPDGCAACPTVLPRFAQVIRLGTYGPPLRALVKQLKYRRQDGVARRLGGMLAQAVTARCQGPRPDLVLAVPSHWRRRFARSYDQARALATAIATAMDLPVGHELVRVRNTPPQTHLPRTGRIENVRGAFDATASKALAGAHVLLVDDVTTTGATANEAARTLLAAGASDVVLAVIAKRDPPRAYAS